MKKKITRETMREEEKKKDKERKKIKRGMQRKKIGTR